MKIISCSVILIFGLLSLTNCSKKEDADPVIPDSAIRDIDGNSYTSVKIGTQTWMVENLKTTRYNDGTPITKVNELYLWPISSVGAYYGYGNDKTMIETYGLLYNWNAVHTGKLAPKGWHIPSNAEWDLLIQYAGGQITAGNKLKEPGHAHWLFPSCETTNESGFTALPGGGINQLEGTIGIGKAGYWWSSTAEFPNSDPWFLYLNPVNNNAYRYMVNGKTGNSVRCIKDN